VAQDALSVARAAAQGFGLFQCEECADAVRDALVAAGHHGEVVEIEPGGPRPYIVCFSYDGGGAAISTNRRHLGVHIAGLTFDNLHPNGVPYADWLADFGAHGGVRIKAVKPF
jgi:hypothetical protein